MAIEIQVEHQKKEFWRLTNVEAVATKLECEVTDEFKGRLGEFYDKVVEPATVTTYLLQFAEKELR